MFCVQSNGSFTGSTNTFVSLSVDDDVLKTECFQCNTKERFHNFISFHGNRFVRECARG